MTELVFTVDDVPPTANLIWRQNPRGGMYLSPAMKTFCELVGLAVRKQRIPDDWKYCGVEIVVEPRQRRGDVDNRIMPVLDALTKCGFWEDDDIVAFVSCRYGAVNKRGRTIIRITPRDSKYD